MDGGGRDGRGGGGRERGVRGGGGGCHGNESLARTLILEALVKGSGHRWGLQLPLKLGPAQQT